MPNPSYYVRGAILAELDAREWAGATLYTRNAGALTVVAPADWGLFGDVLDLLTGRGSGTAALGDQISLAVGAATETATTVTASIDASDRVRLQFAGGTSVTLSAAAGNTAWGFSAAGAASVSDGLGNQLLVGTSDWARGNQALEPLHLTRGASTGNAPKYAAMTVHSLLDTLRTWGSGDADDLNPAGNLCVLELDGGSVAGETTRWGVNADGHVFCSRRTSAATDVTWVSTSFRDALGFTGLESGVVLGASTTVSATYPCPGVLTPSRPFETVRRGTAWKGAAVLASNAGAYTSSWLTRRTYGVDLILDGPADRLDRQDHMLRAVLPAMPPGARVTLYQDWGDGRRTVRTADTSSPAVAPRVAPYSVLYTSQTDGTYGRLLCRRDPAESGALVVAWPNRVQRRLPMSIELAEWEGGQ